MAITFNTNLSALSAQRGINNASSMASSSLQKISSGSRVPQAKDDAAALAIGSKLKAEVAGLTQASNNAGQAVSLLQIADGALSTTADILQRMKSLAVQSSSGQLADSDRALLQQEFSGLQSEVDRIAGGTNFNGAALLNGGDVVATGTQTQSGYLEGKGITVSYDTSKTAADSVFRVSYDYTANVAVNTDGTDQRDTAKLTVTNITTGESQTIDVAALLQAANTANTLDITGEGNQGDLQLTAGPSAGKTVAANFDALGVKLTLDSTFAATTDLNVTLATTTTNGATPLATGSATATFETGARISGGQLATITGGVAFDAATGKLSIGLAAGSGADKVDVAAVTGLEFSTDGSTFTTTLTDAATGAAGNGFFVRAIGSTAAFAFVGTAGITAATTGTATVTLDLSGAVRAVESTTATKSYNFKVGTGTTVNDTIGFSLASATASALGISTASINISTASAADAAITAVGNAITTVSSRRADIGAAESRLAFAQSSINIAIENTTSAQSSLLDVDVSSEITKYTNQNVLMQAGISLLGQANQQPAMLLKLLQ